jgi:hypothetical protein
MQGGKSYKQSGPTWGYTANYYHHHLFYVEYFILIFVRQTMSLGNTVLNLLYFYISTFRSMCVVPNMAVFCSSLTSWIPGYVVDVTVVIIIIIIIIKF